MSTTVPKPIPAPATERRVVVLSDVTPRPAAPPKKKDQGIESLRGIAVILVVLFHVVMDGKHPIYTQGEWIGWFLNYLCHSLEYVRPPLFAGIAGFVYAMRPLSRDGVGEFIHGKLRRILVPYLSVSLLYLVPRTLLRGDSLRAWDFVRVLVEPVAHLWFLPAIFLCFMTILALEQLGFLKDMRRWLLCWGVAASVSILALLLLTRGVTTNLTHMPIQIGYFLLLPAFTAGCGICRFSDVILRPRVIGALAVFVVAGVLIEQLLMAGLLNFAVGRHTPVGILVGVAGTTIIFSLRPTWAPLARLGDHSFAIYLFHFFFVSAVIRIPFAKMGLDSPHVELIARMLAGLFLPIPLEAFFRKFTVTRRLFLGLR